MGKSLWNNFGLLSISIVFIIPVIKNSFELVVCNADHI